MKSFLRIVFGMVCALALATGVSTGARAAEIAPELIGQGLALRKCEAYDRPYDQHLGSR